MLIKCQALFSSGLALALGFGMFKISMLLAFLCMLVLAGQTKAIFYRFKLGGWVLITLLAVFLMVYRLEYIPYPSQIFSMESHYFKILFILSGFAVILAYCIDGENRELRLIWCLSIGAFAWAITTVITSVVLLPPPYYGKIVDLRALARGVLFFGNTLGIASLLIFLSIMLLANFISIPRQRALGFDFFHHRYDHGVFKCRHD